MQVDPSQCHFLHLIIKISNIKNVLEIGTFTGLSALSILLALPDDGKLIALDKNEETNKMTQMFPASCFIAGMAQQPTRRTRTPHPRHVVARSPTASTETPEARQPSTGTRPPRAQCTQSDFLKWVRL